MNANPEEDEAPDKQVEPEPVSEEEVEESFPASDPPAWTRGRERG
jgi:hypothetical protein